MRPLKNIENDFCDEEKELTKLSFWNEPSNGYLPEWGEFQDRFDFFKIFCIIFGLSLLFITSYFIYKVIIYTQNDKEIIQVPSPNFSHKIPVERFQKDEYHPIYNRFSDKEKITCDEEKEKEVEFNETIKFEQTIKPKASIKKPPKQQIVKKPSNIKSSTIKNKSSKIMSNKDQSKESFYIVIDTFDQLQKATRKWHEIKMEQYDIFADLEPLIVVIPTDFGDKYELRAGLVSKNSGIKKCEMIGGKSRLIAMDN